MFGEDPNDCYLVISETQYFSVPAWEADKMMASLVVANGRYNAGAYAIGIKLDGDWSKYELSLDELPDHSFLGVFVLGFPDGWS